MTVQVAARVTAEFSLDLSTAIKIFVTRIAKERRIPVNISKPTFSLNGDEFKSDTEYFKQIPEYWENILAASEEPLEGLTSAKECGWNV
jgi:antitoxin component of RelBE/YafQ-DinJ toxin-antitoxin module